MKTYWIRVFERAVVLLKARPDLEADAAFRLARKDVDEEGKRDSPQPVLPVPIDVCLVCGLPGAHNGLMCPKLNVSGGPHG